MAVKSIAERRKLRQLEATRDSLLEKAQKARSDLVKVRAELKHSKAKRKT